jgi:hypothetical protein
VPLKVAASKKRLVASPNMAWAEDFSPETLKAIGALEVLAAAGLILPGALNIAPILVPVAAVGLGLLMVGAILTHARRSELSNIVINLVLLALVAFVAWGRLGPNALG